MVEQEEDDNMRLKLFSAMWCRKDMENRVNSRSWTCTGYKSCAENYSPLCATPFPPFHARSGPNWTNYVNFAGKVRSAARPSLIACLCRFPVEPHEHTTWFYMCSWSFLCCHDDVHDQSTWVGKCRIVRLDVSGTMLCSDVHMWRRSLHLSARWCWWDDVLRCGHRHSPWTAMCHLRVI